MYDGLTDQYRNNCGLDGDNGDNWWVSCSNNDGYYARAGQGSGRPGVAVGWGGNDGSWEIKRNPHNERWGARGEIKG